VKVFYRIPTMKTVRLGCALFLSLAVAAAKPEQTVDPQKAVPVHSGEWVFSLLPRSFQKNPVVDFTVITEMTAAGRKIPAPSPGNPIYYVTALGTYLQLGQGSPAGEKSPALAELRERLRAALAANGYLPSTLPDHKPNVVIMFYWGSYTPDYQDARDAALDAATQDSADGSIAPFSGAATAEELLPLVLSDVSKRKELLERAGLIGGLKFAAQLGSVLDDEVRLGQVDENASRAAALVGLPDPEFQKMASPFHRFLQSDPKIEMLVEATFSSCYFVVASAYDGAAMARGENRLLWRTKMTVNAIGVSMREALPTLIASSGPYLGRDMNGAELISKRVYREGRVEVGIPTVIEEPAAKP
jgi:hypothetical protein